MLLRVRALRLQLFAKAPVLQDAVSLLVVAEIGNPAVVIPIHVQDGGGVLAPIDRIGVFLLDPAPEVFRQLAEVADQVREKRHVENFHVEALIADGDRRDRAPGQRLAPEFAHQRSLDVDLDGVVDRQFGIACVPVPPPTQGLGTDALCVDEARALDVWAARPKVWGRPNARLGIAVVVGIGHDVPAGMLLHNEFWRDLLDIVAALGELDVHRRGLHQAALDRPFPVSSGVGMNVGPEQASSHRGGHVSLAPLQPSGLVGDWAGFDLSH